MSSRTRLTLAATALSLAALFASQATATEIRGKADVPFKVGLLSSKPDAKLRQQALEAAKVSAWKRYTATFSPSQLQGYKPVEDEILGNLDEYIIDFNVLDESVNKESQLYSVSIRASINEAALANRLNQAGVGAAGAQYGAGELFSFMFVAREVESLKSFDERRTQVRMEEGEVSARQSSAMQGGSASLNESQSGMAKVTTGGSTLRKANEVSYRVRSAADVDAAIGETLAGYGFEVVGYEDVVATCGGVAPEKIRQEFTTTDDISGQTRKGSIDGARACDVNYFAIGTLDIGMQDTDPVTGNQRVHVSVRGQVWDISTRLPRRVASVGPVQYAGLGPDSDVAMRNALRLSGEKAARALVDQLNARGKR